MRKCVARVTDVARAIRPLRFRFATQLIAAGLAHNDTLEQMRQGFREWGTHPHAFAAEAWGEAVAWKEEKRGAKSNQT